jgi:hypothetical protein
MTPVAYFDTNVVRSLAANQRELILSMKIKRGLFVILSVAVIEELLSSVDKVGHATAIQRVREYLDLVDINRIAKPTDLLLTDDIRSYARTGNVSSPLLQQPDRDHFAIGMFDALRQTSRRATATISGIVAEVRNQKEHFKFRMTENLQAARTELESAAKRGEKSPAFPEYLASTSANFARSLADHIGLGEDCEKRGIDGLLRIRSVRMTVGIGLSFFYAQMIERLQPQIGDAIDQKHAVMAASRAEVFVSNDRRLRRFANRVPMERFIVTDLVPFVSTSS